MAGVLARVRARFKAWARVRASVSVRVGYQG